MIFMKKSSFLFFLLFFMLILASGQTIRYVKSIPSGLGDGSSWENASSDLMLMVNNSNAGDFVWVAEGEYVGSALPNSSFEMKSGVTVLGGFPSLEMGRLENRNAKTFPTILKAEGERRVLKSSPSIIEQTTWDGFVLQGGDIPQYKGGGAYLEDHSVLRNCIIRHCHAAQGGGIYLFNGGVVDHCLIENNSTVLSGGGVLINQNGLVQHCVVRSNQADNAGGVGVEIQGKVLNCVISNNTATSSSGGLYVSGNATVVNCTVVKNKAEGSIGEQVLTNAKIYNSVFWGNTPLMTQSETTVSDCAIEGWMESDGNVVLSAMNNDPGASSPWFKQPSSNAGHLGDVDGMADWSVTKESALVNHGANGWVPESLDVDLAGFQRIYDDVVDVGAFELQEKLSTGILNPEYGLQVAHSSGQLVVHGLVPGQTIALFNASGQLIAQEVATSDLSIIQTGSLVPGLYFLKSGTWLYKWVKR